LVAIEEGYEKSLGWWNQARQKKLELLEQLSIVQTDASLDNEESKELFKKRCRLVDALRRNHISKNPLENIIYGNSGLGSVLFMFDE
jgi:hypothetical protein